MLIAKALARWLPLALDAAVCGLLDRFVAAEHAAERAPRHGEPGRRTRRSRRNPAAASGGTTAAVAEPRLSHGVDSPTARTGPTAGASTNAGAKADAPSHAPEFQPQNPAASAGGFRALGDGPAPAPDAVPTNTEIAAAGPGLPSAPVAQTSRQSGKIPPLPGNESDPPAQPSARPAPTAAVSDDSLSPPPIPSVVRPSVAPATTAPVAADNSPQLREVHKKAVAKFATIDSYVARLRRREQINGKDKPEELMLFKFRKQPWSVYFKWLGIEGHNRECIYVKGRYGNLIHTLLAEGDVMLMHRPAKKISLAPDSVLVRSRSRHAIKRRASA